MPLDQYKTQVLLLHSEQSALDSLSSGFNDSYTVHCATSGSEALNTLVETPINVIVTAQDLPGMSGLDALREAKKRSPDTIGILLAGSSGSDVQALVGEEEVFQVVTGSVTTESLTKLVENATRQMRLMALAGAANDTVASVDQPAEHIVMETSDNGSTIISDGTGRMPALDPTKVPASVSVGSRSVDVLVLTKDQEFLETIKDSSRGMHKVFYANTLAQANDIIRKHKIGVAVVDAAMVGEKIEQLTQHLRKGSARLVSIVAGRRDDGEMMMDLINRGKVYRFLLKPVSPGRARLAVESSVKHHLEAADAAFKISAGAAAGQRPTAKPTRKKPAVQAAPKPDADSEVAAKPQSKRATTKVTPVAPIDPPLGATTAPEIGSPNEDSLADAFGQEETSFTETVTSLISTVTAKFSSADNVSPAIDDSATAVSMARSLDGDSSDDGFGSLLKNPKLLGIGATAIAVLAAAIFWFSGADDSMPGATGQNPGAAAIGDTGNSVVDIEAIVAEARLARDAGQIYNPAGSNAIELFATALAADPQDNIIAAELDAVVGVALGLAETAILNAQVDDADAALQRVTLVDPQNSRLPFLTAQVSQMLLRRHLDNARVAMRENRFEDAANALNAARSTGAADSGEIAAVAAELKSVHGELRIDEVLAKADERLAAGLLLDPVNDNARYYFQLVLSSDPSNTAAREGLSVVAGKLVFMARTQMDAGDFGAAEDILAHARVVDPDNEEVATATSALTNARAGITGGAAGSEDADRKAQVARDAAAEQERVAAAERQAEIDRLAKLQREAELERQAELDREAEAERQAKLEREAEAERQAELDREAEAERQAELDREAEAERQAELDREAEAERQAAAEKLANESVEDAASVESSTNEQETSEVPVTSKAAVDAGPPAQAETTASAALPIAVSSLKRVRYVAPKYPRGAQRRNQSGWVDIVFTVTTEGSVKDVEVRDSDPGDVFVNAAVKSVERWEFEPVIEAGTAVEKRAGIRLLFALE